MASKTPFLITLNAPVCEQTNIRPSGAIAIAVGEAIPLATVVSTKPEGSVAAEPETDKAYNKNTIAMNDGALCIPESRKKQEVTVRPCFRRGQRITPGKFETAVAALADEAKTEWTDLKCIARAAI